MFRHRTNEYLDGARVNHMFSISIWRIVIYLGISKHNFYVTWFYFKPRLPD